MSLQFIIGSFGNRPFTVRPFTYNRMEPEPAANNFAFSTLRFDLNEDFLSALDDAGVIPANKVLEAEWSLADHDGTNRYGVAVCKVAMLPEPLVRKQCFRKHVQEWLQKIRSGEITR